MRITRARVERVVRHGIWRTTTSGVEGVPRVKESDGSSKESAKSDVKMTADKIRKLVAKFSFR
jgi:hypothetical protein